MNIINTLDKDQERTIHQLLIKHNMQDYTSQLINLILYPSPEAILSFINIVAMTQFSRGVAHVTDAFYAKMNEGMGDIKLMHIDLRRNGDGN